MNIIFENQSIGSVRNIQVDNFHYFGIFKPNDHFTKVGLIMEQLEGLWKKEMDDELSDQDEKQLEELTLKIDELELKVDLGNGDIHPIYDFKIVEGECEFKLDI